MTRKKSFNPSKTDKWDDSEERKSFVRRRNQSKEFEIDDDEDDQNLGKEEIFDEDDETEEDIVELIGERDGRGDFTGWDENIGNYDENGNRNSVLRYFFGNE